MKKLMFAFVVAAATVCMAEEDEYAAEGGIIRLWPKDPGTFYFVCAQDKVGVDLVKKCTDQLAAEFMVDIRVVKGEAKPFDVRKASAELAKLGAKGAVWIVDDQELPMSLAASEAGWGVLNVAPLTADTLQGEKFEARILKSVRRAYGNVHGCTDALMMPACVMNQALSVKELDALICQGYSPESHSKIQKFLKKFGYKRCNIGTYQEACEAGWAPAPTNAVQKAIWSKVHAMPTAPIRIKPGDKPKTTGK